MEEKLAALNALVAYARANSPFYARHLPEGEIESPADLARLPLCSAEDIREHGREMLCCPASRVRRIVSLETSGTSGRPKRLCFTEADLERTVDFFHHGMERVCGPYRRVAIFLPGNSPDGLCQLLAAGIRRFGGTPLYYGPIADYGDAARWSRELRADTLVGIPAQIRRLALTAPDLGYRRVLLSSDSLPRSLGETIARKWDCQVLNHYGMTESGYGLAVQYPGEAAMSLRKDLYLERLPDGELVLTTLFREAMPLIRYRTGDLGRLSPEGDVLELLGRKTELTRPVTLRQLDETLFAQDGVLDYTAAVQGGVLRVTVLGRAGDARAALEEAFPEYRPEVEETDALPPAGGKRALRWE